MEDEGILESVSTEKYGGDIDGKEKLLSLLTTWIGGQDEISIYQLRERILDVMSTSSQRTVTLLKVDKDGESKPSVWIHDPENKENQPNELNSRRSMLILHSNGEKALTKSECRGSNIDSMTYLITNDLPSMEFLCEYMKLMIESITHRNGMAAANQDNFVKNVNSKLQKYSEIVHIISNRDGISSLEDLFRVEVFLGHDKMERKGEIDKRQQIEKQLDRWMYAISNIIQKELSAENDGDDPLSSTTMNRLKKTLGRVVFHIEKREIQQVVEEAIRLKISNHAAFDFSLKELRKYYVDASENAKFLETMEKQINIISKTELLEMKTALPQLLSVIKTVCTISKYFSAEDIVFLLLMRVSEVISKKISDVVHLKMIVSFGEDTTRMLKICSEIVDEWQNSYFELQRQLEEKGIRWEFNSAKLMAQPLYLKKLCLDILELHEKVKTIHILECLGRAVPNTNDSSSSRLDSFVNEQIAEERALIHRKNAQKWKDIKGTLLAFVCSYEVQVLKALSEVPINSLSTMELMNSIDAHNSIIMNNTLTAVLKQIIVRYGTETQIVKEYYMDNSYKKHRWTHFPELVEYVLRLKYLMNTLKSPFLKLRKISAISEDILKDTQSNYVEIMTLLNNEQLTYIDTGIGKQVDSLLSQPILANYGADFCINYHQDLMMLMYQCHYFEKLGLKIPENQLFTSAQLSHCKLVFKRVGAILQQFREMETIMTTDGVPLVHIISDTRSRMLGSLAKFLNWKSVGTIEFLTKCEKELDSLTTVVMKEFVDARDSISKEVKKMSNVRLLDGISDHTPSGDKNLFFYDFVESVEELLRLKSPILQESCQGIISHLGNIENLFFGTRTYKHKDLRMCYKYYERKLYNIFKKISIQALSHLEDILNKGKASTIRLLIRVSILNDELSFDPTPGDFVKGVEKISSDLVTLFSSFPRWLDGQCKSYKQNLKEYTFADDLNNDTDVNMSKKNVAETISSCSQLFTSFALEWRGIVRAVAALKQKDNQWLSLIEFESLMDKIEANKAVEGILISCKGNSDTRGLVFQRASMVGFLRNGVRKNIRIIMERQVQAIENTCAKLQAKFIEFTSSLSTSGGETNVDVVKLLLETVYTIQNNGPQIDEKLKVICDSLILIEDSNVGVESSTAWEYHANVSDQWNTLQKLSSESFVLVQQLSGNHLEKIKNQEQRFTKAVSDLHLRLQFDGPDSKDIVSPNGSGRESLLEWRRLHDEMRGDISSLQSAQEIFSVPMSEYPTLNDVRDNVERLEYVLECATQLDELIASVKEDKITEFDAKPVLDQIIAMKKKNIMADEDISSLRNFRALEKRLAEFENSVNIISKLAHPTMKKRHFDELASEVDEIFLEHGRITVEDVMKIDLQENANIITEIASSAVKEVALEASLKEMSTRWKDMSIQFKLHELSSGEEFEIISGIEDIFQVLEDDLMNLTSISASKMAVRFTSEIRTLEKSLTQVGEVVEVWMKLQMKWLYLEAIFSSEDIQMQLASESKRYFQYERRYKDIMYDAIKNRHILQCTQDKLEPLKDINSGFESCQKHLGDYLETKRNEFNRFYFISDDELLGVLGSSDPEAIQVHINKMFDNVNHIQLEKIGSATNVVGLRSCEGEELMFNDAVVCERGVEVWMKNVEIEMRKALRTVIKDAIYSYPKSTLLDWLKKYHGMAGIAVSQLWWTFFVEHAFKEVQSGNSTHTLQTLLHEMDKQIAELVGEPATGNLRKKLMTAIIVYVHARDIVARLVRDSIYSEKNFEWESQLRFYWDKLRGTLVARQFTGELEFGYEYMGLNGRLVITPLTDRCYFTLTTALQMHMGGAPAGPAGTGKTETVKDLAKALGRLCLVFNCGEGLDVKGMSSLFRGLAQTGAWGCFDEFNRLDASVLSILSLLVESIQNALAQHIGKFQLEEKDISLNSNIGIFITMNPGYAGRTELPDNMKALFRPVVMTVPDMELICEILLFSEGFTEAKILSRKIAVVYDQCKQQLSKQHHYDFGLRALKSVLAVAGAGKRSSPDAREDMIIIKALQDMNVPKLVQDDVTLFLSLISDLFPGIKLELTPSLDFKNKLEESAIEMGLVVCSKQIDLAENVERTMKTRHSTLIVGPTQSGKTTLISLVSGALKKSGTNVRLHEISPKSVSVSELHGVLDPLTRDWTDGLLSWIFRDANKPLSNGKQEKHIILFDGDIDAVWIENLNSVMDDNRLLTLANGERIRLADHCSLLFEVGNLHHASPATVSRCGIIYVDDHILDYHTLFKKWMNGLSFSESTKSYLIEKVLGLFEAVFNFIFEGLDIDGKKVNFQVSTMVPTCRMTIVKQFCFIWNSRVNESLLNESNTVLDSIALYCILWSVGPFLDVASRDGFESLLRMLSGFESQSESRVKFGLLPTACLFEFKLDISSFEWVRCGQNVEEDTLTERLNINSLIQTTDSEITHEFLGRYVLSDQPVLVVGESGVGKTKMISAYLSSLDSSKFSVMTLNFSAYTSTDDVISNITEKLEKLSRNVYGPVAGKKLILFVEDAHLPSVDTYGTQQPISLLSFFIQRRGFYRRDKEGNWNWISVRDVHLIVSLTSSSGGCKYIDERFLSKFTTFQVFSPSHESILKIYNTILDDFLSVTSACSLGVHIVELSIKLYNFVKEKLKPTPDRFTYVFTLRDIGRVIGGIMRVSEETLDEKMLASAWFHECMRVFSDRLVDEHDWSLFTEKMRSLLEELPEEHREAALRVPLLFSDINKKSYSPVESYGVIRGALSKQLELYNSENKRLELVLFDEAIDSILKIQRVLKSDEAGHVLLVGNGGSGKRSLSRFAAYICGFSIYEFPIRKNYGYSSFLEDMKELFISVGVQKKRIAVLFTDANVKEESFLASINTLLSGGFVPGLFNNAEREEVFTGLRADVRKAGIADTKENIWSFFVEQALRNLRIILAMSPSGNHLARRCRDFPAMVSGTSILWLRPWSGDAVKEIAANFLESQLASLGSEDGLKDEIISYFYDVYLSTGQESQAMEGRSGLKIYSTPKQFLDFLSTFRSIHDESVMELEQQISRLEGGLKKLTQAAEEVDKLSSELKTQRVLVKQKTETNNELLEKISRRTDIANEKQGIAVAKEKELQTLTQKIQVQKEEAEEALAEAIPVLEQAKEALRNLDKKEVTEIRSFAKPHVLVQSVCESVAILLGGKDISWRGAKQMMTSSTFLNDLLELKIDTVTDKQVKMVREYFKIPKFSVSEMKKISIAGAGLLTWVEAIVNYYVVYKDVAPKKAAVAQATASLQESKLDLKRTKDELSSLSEELKELGNKYDVGISEQQVLKKQSELMEKRLIAASKLISGLETEKKRWVEEITSLKRHRETILGDTLLSGSFLGYAGAFSQESRRRLMETSWKASLSKCGIRIQENFSIEDFLCDDVKKAKWSTEGLPGDDLSIQNGILVTRSRTTCLFLDPQFQAVGWLKQHSGSLSVYSEGDSKLMKKIELAVKFGNEVLVVDIGEELTPSLSEFITSEIKEDEGDGRKYVIIDGVEVSYDPKFRLYLASNMSTPRFSPEIQGMTTMINFNLTREGLKEQLLNSVVGFERKELEEQRKEVILSISENMRSLKEQEDVILKQLSEASGNILDDTELIESLENAKKKSQIVSGKIAEGLHTRMKIDDARLEYVPVADRGVILYFLMDSLSSMSAMSEYSLSSFMDLFSQSQRESEPSESLKTRLDNIQNHFTHFFYEYISIGLLEKYKLSFSLQLAISILLEDGSRKREVDFLIRGNTNLGPPPQPNPYEWLSDASWKDLYELSDTCISYRSILDSIAESEEQWRDWISHPNWDDGPELVKNSDDFGRLLLLRCFRKDRLYPEISNYIVSVLDKKFVQPPVVKMRWVYGFSSNRTPIMMIQSPGANASADIHTFAEEMGIQHGKVKSVALGQGQEAAARRAIGVAAQRGHWIILHNCHLMLSWVPEIASLIENCKEGFRLWMTTEMAPEFPKEILRRCFKVVVEPPTTFRLKMMNCYMKMGESIFCSCERPEFKKLLYMMAYFHSILQERKKYGKIGWNVPYEFSESDFRSSMFILRMFMEKYKDIPWDSLSFLIGEAMYGGRVTDEFDRKTLMTYLTLMFDMIQRFLYQEKVETDPDSTETFSLPTGTTFEDHLEKIRSISLDLKPTSIGLQTNATIEYLTESASSLLTDLQRMQSTSSAIESGNSRSDSSVVKNAQRILKKLPELFDLKRLKRELPSSYYVLFDEIRLFNDLLSVIRSSLTDLLKAYGGKILLIPSLEKVARSLTFNEIPDLWLRFAPQTTKSLSFWLDHLNKRHELYSKWISEGEPRSMWFGGLHSPESYLSAFLQRVCRKRGWAIDDCALNCRISEYRTEEEIPHDESSEIGFISGLIMEGARWNEETKRVEDQHENELRQYLPLVSVSVVRSEEMDSAGSIECPVYITSLRMNAAGYGYVFTVYLDTKIYKNLWVNTNLHP